MSDLLEALKDTNRLIEAILMMQPGHNHSETLKETSTRAQLLTERIIEASRQAGAVQDRSDVSAKDVRIGCLLSAMDAALRNLEAIPAAQGSVSIDDAIRHLKAGIEGGAA